MSSRSVSFLVVASWLALLACACSKVSEAPQVGTNTNWLKTCSKQSECGARGSCVCGVCTRACSADEQCAVVHDETSCQPVSAAACESSSETAASACLQGCRADGDCSTLQNGRCSDGLCVPVLGAALPAGGPASEPVPGGSATEPAYALERVDADVVISDAYTECERDSECTLVGTACNGCCGLATVNTSLLDTYVAERERACSDYRGGQCDCDFPNVVGRCEAGRCRAVSRDTSACFSPSQHQERALEAGAIGCRCHRQDATICTGGVEMRCAQEGSAGLRGGETALLWAWRVSESRTCGLAADTECSADRRRASAEDCLAAFAACQQLVSGEYCGLLTR